MRWLNCTGYADLWIARPGGGHRLAERGPSLAPKVHRTVEIVGRDSQTGEVSPELVRSFVEFASGLPDARPDVRLVVPPEVFLYALLVLRRDDCWTFAPAEIEVRDGAAYLPRLVQRVDVWDMRVEGEITVSAAEGGAA